MTGAASRKTVAMTTSLALHAALIALVAGRALVRLQVEPAPLLLTLVEASDRTAGPGELSAELRVAASSESAASPPAPAPPKPEPEVAETTIEKEVDPVPIAVPRPKPAAQKQPAPSARAAAPKVAGAQVASGSGAPSSTGTDSRSSAPEWAPTARVRYEQLLFAWMNRHKQYPMLAQRRGLEGSGSVRVRIDRNGRVLERTVDRSTGEAMLDQAALEMVRRANPFPAVPPEYAGEGFEFVAPIQYRLR